LTTVDVGAVLDEGTWSGYQKLLVFATALAIVLDGVDNQLLALAIPSLSAEWGIPATTFASVIAVGLVGMMFGGALGGFVGDRYGRRVALLGSTVVFGILTFAIAFVDDILSLAVLRFLAGLGLGGAMPNAAALASEYVPRRRRAFAVTLTIVCVPLGGTLGALLGGQIIPEFGWRAMFVVGGVLPLLLFAVLLKTLPESPRYMARRRTRWWELARLLKRLGHTLPEGELAFVDASESGKGRASAAALLAPEYRRDTLALGASFFFCLLSAYMGFNWIPSMLGSSGVPLDLARNGLLTFNLGGVAGAIAGAVAIQRLGSRVTMLGMSVGAVAGSIMLSLTPVGPELAAVTLLAMLAFTGGLINGVQTTMYALAAHVYPTSIRATGVGAAVSFGRIGGVLSSYAGSSAIAAGGPGAFFATLAGTMTLVFVSLAAVRRHIPRVAGNAGAAYAVQPVER
jgi:AAHS family 4-hydroxybenzoate transporter-like MFS transporter